MKKIIALAAAALMLTSAMLTPVGAEDTVPKPVTAYSFDDVKNPGRDISGNGNSLSVKGTVKSADGKYGKAIRLDYTGALVAKQGSGGADFVDLIETKGTKQLTLMYWVKYSKADLASWNSDYGWRRIVSNGVDGSTGFGGFTMLGLADNLIVPGNINPACVFYTEKVQTWSGGNWSTYPWTEDWAHVAWTVDLNTNRCMFYVNGTAIFDLAEKDLSTGLSNLSRAFSIGANWFTDGDGNDVFDQPFAGEIDDFYVFDRFLDASAIAYYMNNNYVPPKDPTPPATSDATLALIPAAVIAGAVISAGKKKRF